MSRYFEDHDECEACPTIVDLTLWPPIEDGDEQHVRCALHRVVEAA